MDNSELIGVSNNGLGIHWVGGRRRQLSYCAGRGDLELPASCSVAASSLVEAVEQGGT